MGAKAERTGTGEEVEEAGAEAGGDVERGGRGGGICGGICGKGDERFFLAPASAAAAEAATSPLLLLPRDTSLE